MGVFYKVGYQVWVVQGLSRNCPWFTICFRATSACVERARPLEQNICIMTHKFTADPAGERGYGQSRSPSNPLVLDALRDSVDKWGAVRHEQNISVALSHSIRGEGKLVIVADRDSHANAECRAVDPNSV